MVASSFVRFGYGGASLSERRHDGNGYATREWPNAQRGLPVADDLSVKLSAVDAGFLATGCRTFCRSPFIRTMLSGIIVALSPR